MKRRRPLAVSKRQGNGQGTGGSANTFTAVVNGANAAYAESSPGYSQGSISFIVPAAATYSIVHGGSGAGTISFWGELR